MLTIAEVVLITLWCFMQGYNSSYGTRPRWTIRPPSSPDTATVVDTPVTGVEDDGTGRMQVWGYWAIHLHLSPADAGIKVHMFGRFRVL